VVLNLDKDKLLYTLLWRMPVMDKLQVFRLIRRTVVVLTFLIFSGCATSGGGGVGGVVIDAPTKDFAATINGTVLSDGKGIENAKVELINYEGEDLTDLHGRFSIPFTATTRLGVNRIRVLVRASKDGFRTRTKGLYVVIQQEASVIVELLPKADQ
jgi:hypothetical protein